MQTAFIFALTLACHGAAWLLWARRVVPAEVAKNDADITANGSADNLRKGYHQRRQWVRFWWGAGLTVAANAPLLWAGILPYLLGCLALGVLLTAYFARWFTPLLNLARQAAGRLDITEYYASHDSASWPDAWAYRLARAKYVTANQQATYASQLLQAKLEQVYRWGWWAYAALVVGLLLLLLFR